MSDLPRKVVALDPGGQTGIAVWCDGAHTAFDLPAADAMWWLYRELNGYPLSDPKSQEPLPGLIISESIHINRRTHEKGHDVLISVEQIGVSRFLSQLFGAEFKLQSPAEAKMFSTDNKLRSMDWWTVGTDHARDASRHLMVHLCERDSEFRALVLSRVSS